MIVDMIADLHGYFPKLDGGDTLIIAGDLTTSNSPTEYLKFFSWLDRQKYKHKIVVAGNHDGYLEINPDFIKCLSYDFIYLKDSYITLEGLKIWGSPYTPSFQEWHFMKKRGKEIQKHWDLIPNNTDILITHGPPWGILDCTNDIEDPDKYIHCGCEDLKKTLERINLKLHVFGHIHEGYGMDYMLNPKTKNETIFVNASYVNSAYKPVNKPYRIYL